MTYWTTHPRAFDADGKPDGRYAVQITGGKVTGWTALPATTVGAVIAGDGIGVDNTDPTNPIVSAKQLLMQDGVTSPPVPIETEAGDDWLYQD